MNRTVTEKFSQLIKTAQVELMQILSSVLRLPELRRRSQSRVRRAENKKIKCWWRYRNPFTGWYLAVHRHRSWCQKTHLATGCDPIERGHLNFLELRANIIKKLVLMLFHNLKANLFQIIIFSPSTKTTKKKKQGKSRSNLSHDNTLPLSIWGNKQIRAPPKNN